MGQLIIVLGDKTTHGGTVITAAPTTDTLGLSWARKGDMVACPRCKGVFPIAQGDPDFICDGAPVAYHGCRVACGAMLIGGSQGVTTTVPTGGAAPSADLVSGRFGNVGKNLLAGYEDEALDDDGKRFKGRFQVLDCFSGSPIVGADIRVRSTEGQYIVGKTDSEGYTQWVERDAAEALAFDLDDSDQA